MKEPLGEAYLYYFQSIFIDWLLKELYDLLWWDFSAAVSCLYHYCYASWRT